MRRAVVVAVASTLAAAGAQARPAKAVPLAQAVGALTRFTPLPARAGRRPVAEVVKAEILLGRARFSVGAVDGIDGANFRETLAAFQKQAGLPVSGRLDEATWARLGADTAPALATYKITAKDAAGPFVPTIPAKMEDMVPLKRLGFRDLSEALAERFHLSVGLLAALNPNVRLAADAEIQVPALAAPAPDAKASRLVVDKPGHALQAYDKGGKLLGFFIASIGSEEKPAPTGQFVIRRLIHDPDYTYKPEYHFKGVKADAPFTIAPGPNNPVGSVWLDLSYEGYGIHGTPDPEAIGKTQSHGCVRLTNWDAEAVASMVDIGVPVSFEDVPGANTPPPAAPPPAAEPPKQGAAPKKS